MALFGNKKKTANKSVITTTASLSHGLVIRRPRVTEKTAKAMENGKYVFDVALNATKGSVRSAVIALFKVHPLKVAVLPVKGKRVFVKGHHGESPTGRKAYVTLKKGEKIETAS